MLKQDYQTYTPFTVKSVLLALVAPLWMAAQTTSLSVLVEGAPIPINQPADSTECCFITMKSTQKLTVFDVNARAGNRIFRLQENTPSENILQDTTIGFFTDLKSGTYTLESYLQKENELILLDTLKIIVKKDNTWWYIPAFVLYLLVLSGAAVYAITISKVRNASKIYTMRSEWTNRLHTDLGGDLLGVSGRIVMAQQELQSLVFNVQNNLVKAQDILRGIERKLRFVFDLIDPKKNSLQTVLNDLHWHAQECFAMKNIQLDYQNELSDTEILKIDLTRIEKLGLIAKELVNNSYKHSEATHAIIHIKREKKGLQLEISDNGKGFDWKDKLNEPDDHNGNNKGGRIGMKSLFSLAKEGLMDFQFQSEPGKGTRASIFVPEL